MKENKALKQASDKLDTLSHDEKMRRLAELREKAIISENTNLSASYKKGVQEGLEKGLQEGSELTKENIAIELLKKGMDISFVQETTGLSTNKIEELKRNLD